MRGAVPRALFAKLATRAACLALAAIATVALHVACNGGGGTCDNGFSKECLSDGVTCTCAPPCQTIADCAEYSLCTTNDTCLPCYSPTGSACGCITGGFGGYNLCAPLSWQPGESVYFALDGGPTGAPPAFAAPSGSGTAQTDGATE
jgi:hypothetical protein